MKKYIIRLIIVILLIIGLIFFYHFFKEKVEEEKIKNAVIEITTVEDLTFEFLEEIHVSDLIESINGKIEDDYRIDTTTLGKQKVSFTFTNDDGITLDQSIEINVVDTVAPVIWLGNTYTLNKGSELDAEAIMCGDNEDESPKREIIGTYDVNTIGSYSLTYKATDHSGNVSTQDFTLHIIAPSNSDETTPSNVRTEFNDVIKKYKNENTRIGIDVSGWQKEIDFEKIKNAGVEFIIIKVGGSAGTYGDYYVDSKFLRNIALANEYDIDVGIYYYSYAETVEQSIRDAKWVVEQLEGYEINLPVAFDWENWQYFNSYEVSFYELTKMATSFLDIIEKAGYKGMNYSSKSYLERIWLKNDYPVWLAHYTDYTNYAEPYIFWQMCNNGRIDGIDGDVDIDIMYLEKNEN